MIRSICHELVEETVFVHVHCLCDVHDRCALGFVKYTIPRARANGARTLTIRLYMRRTKELIYIPFVNRSVVSADRRTRQRR